MGPKNTRISISDLQRKGAGQEMLIYLKSFRHGELSATPGKRLVMKSCCACVFIQELRHTTMPI